jgi:hypothetical protein
VVEAAPGCCIEVALDRGTIRAGDAVLPLAELELESKSATPAQLLAFGCALAQRHALFADERSKAARGYALFSGEPALSPRHASQPALAADLSCREAFCTIARECLAQIAANLLGALDSDDPEYAHQLRVGVRRLRSAIKLFEPLLPERFASTWQAQLRTLAALAGEAREWDVLLSEILAPVGRLAPESPIEQEGKERAGPHQGRQHQRERRIDQPHPLDHQEAREPDHAVRDEQRDDTEGDHAALDGVPATGHGQPRPGSHHERDGQGHGDDKQRIQSVADEIAIGQRPGIVAQHDRIGQPFHRGGQGPIDLAQRQGQRE